MVALGHVASPKASGAEMILCLPLVEVQDQKPGWGGEAGSRD